MDDRLLLFDGNNLFKRAYHGMMNQGLSHNGIPTWGIFGTVQSIATAIRTHKPTHVVVVFDLGKSAYRLNIWPKYKAGRPEQTDEVFQDSVDQLQETQELLPLFGLQVWQEQGIEADDIIGTLVDRFSRDLPITILSGDKDLKQLVSDSVTLYHPSLGTKPEICWRKQDVIDHFGIPPERLPEIWALSGDKVDNIPGVPGIGEKTAIKFITKYGDLSNVTLSDEKKIQGYRHDIAMSHKLVMLYPELSSFDMDLDHIRFVPATEESEDLTSSLHRLGFQELSSRLKQGTLWSERGLRLRDLQKQ